MITALFALTAFGQENCLTDEIPLANNEFSLWEPAGCKESDPLFVEIENRTSFCLRPRWTGYGATSVVNWLFNGHRVPAVVVDATGQAYSCIPPGAKVWSYAPSNGAQIEAIGFDNSKNLLPPRPTAVNGVPAFLVGKTMRQIDGSSQVVPSRVATVCPSRVTDAGTSLRLVLLDNTACYSK